MLKTVISKPGDAVYFVLAVNCLIFFFKDAIICDLVLNLDAVLINDNLIE